MYKITMLQQFSTMENGAERGSAIRDKAILISDLLTQPHRLEEERAQARMYREKMGMATS